MFKNIGICLAVTVVMFEAVISFMPGYFFHFTSVIAQKNEGNTTNMGFSDFKIYSNPTFGIIMHYPSNWLRIDLSNNGTSNLVVAFKSPPGSAPSALTLIAEMFGTQNFTLSKFVQSNVDTLNQSGRIISVNASTPYILGGYPAHKIVYTAYSSEGIKIEVIQILSLVGDKSFLLTYVAPIANYSSDQNIVEAILNSISIKNNSS